MHRDRRRIQSRHNSRIYQLPLGHRRFRVIEPAPEQAMQAQQMRAMQQQMQAMQQALAQIELRTKAAEAVEAEADAVKAQAEAAQARAEANGAARQDAFEGMAFEVGARQAALMRGPI